VNPVNNGRGLRIIESIQRVCSRFVRGPGVKKATGFPIAKDCGGEEKLAVGVTTLDEQMPQTTITRNNLLSFEPENDRDFDRLMFRDKILFPKWNFEKFATEEDVVLARRLEMEISSAKSIPWPSSARSQRILLKGLRSVGKAKSSPSGLEGTSPNDETAGRREKAFFSRVPNSQRFS